MLHDPGDRMPRFSESTVEGAVLEWFERFGYGQRQTRMAETWTLLPKLLSGEVRVREAVLEGST